VREQEAGDLPKARLAESRAHIDILNTAVKTPNLLETGVLLPTLHCITSVERMLRPRDGQLWACA